MNSMQVDAAQPDELAMYQSSQRAAEEKYGKMDPRYPSVRQVALIVLKLTPHYAQIEETERTSVILGAYLSWFLVFACLRLELPLNTHWEEIFYLVGVPPEEAYASKKEYLDAYHVGEAARIKESSASAMFKELETLAKKILIQV